MLRSRGYSWLTGIAFLVAATLAGCGPSEPVSLPRPAAPPVAIPGWPSPPDPVSPSPILQSSPFGLYAALPRDDTLRALSTGTLSPDGRFRSALTAQGLWVARVDGAWLWQVELPVPKAVETRPPQPGTHLPEPPEQKQPSPAPRQPQPAKAPTWTARNTLLVHDDQGGWHEATPLTATITAFHPVTPIPAASRETLASIEYPKMPQ